MPAIGPSSMAVYVEDAIAGKPAPTGAGGSF
ncbi:hypothetical protein QF012_002230 [Pseudomonas laurylsulfatiphila]